MPRKASTITPAVRIRENQRRARARRKELINDLTSRIRTYETQGVMASAQVQEAARKVLLENRRLRALLIKKGVSAVEIEASLHEHSDAFFTDALPTSGPADMNDEQRQAAPSVDGQQPVEMPASDNTNKLVSASSPPAVLMDIGLESASQADKTGTFVRSLSDNELLGPSVPAENDLGRGSPNLFEHVSDCYCPEIQPVPSRVKSSGRECSVAANILADFRGHGDAEQARAELGCPETAQCSITNAALFHALDSDL